MARGKKVATKKVAGKKVAVKKTAQKKTAQKKAVGKKPAATRSAKATRKVVRKKSVAKKTAARKTSVKKTAVKKKSARKVVAKKLVSKKGVARKVVARAAKKPVSGERPATGVAQVATSPSRRKAPRNSSGRRLAARAPVSRAQLIKKTLVEAKRAKPANAQQKAVQKAKTLRARKKALTAKDKRLPALRSPSARARRKDGSEAPSSRRLSIRAAVTRETSRSPAQRAGAAGELPFRLHQLGIRDEHPTDRAAILALLAETFGDSAQAEKLQALRLESRVGSVLVAQHGERLVGCGALFENAVESEAGDVPIAEIGVLAVTPLLQRKGIGTQLVLAMIESARASGAKVLLAQGLEGVLTGLGFSANSATKIDENAAVLALKLAEDDENEVPGRLKHPMS